MFGDHLESTAWLGGSEKTHFHLLYVAFPEVVQDVADPKDMLLQPIVFGYKRSPEPPLRVLKAVSSAGNTSNLRLGTDNGSQYDSREFKKAMQV